jgi:hypothetical protein
MDERNMNALSAYLKKVEVEVFVSVHMALQNRDLLQHARCGHAPTSIDSN